MNGAVESEMNTMPTGASGFTHYLWWPGWKIQLYFTLVEPPPQTWPGSLCDKQDDHFSKWWLETTFESCPFKLAYIWINSNYFQVCSSTPSETGFDLTTLFQETQWVKVCCFVRSLPKLFRTMSMMCPFIITSKPITRAIKGLSLELFVDLLHSCPDSAHVDSVCVERNSN